MDEKKLIARLQKRSRAALEQAIEQYTPYVSAVVWRTAGAAAAREDLEEAVSDVFLALWSHAEELDAEKGLRPWLGTVARNKAVDRLRRAPAPPPIPEEAPAPGPGPQEAAEQMERAEALWRAVEALGEPDSSLFLRHYWYGEKLGDAAKTLNLSAVAAKTRLSRGRKKLRDILTRGGEGL